MRGEYDSDTYKRNSESRRSKKTLETRDRAKIRREILFKLNQKQESQISLHTVAKERSTDDIVDKIKKEIETTIRTINEKQRSLESKLSLDSTTLNKSFLRIPPYKAVSKPLDSKVKANCPRRPRSIRQAKKAANEDKKANRRSKIIDSFSTEDDYSEQSDNSGYHYRGNSKMRQNYKSSKDLSSRQNRKEKSVQWESESERAPSTTSYSSSLSEHEQCAPKIKLSSVNISTDSPTQESQQSGDESSYSLEEVVLPLRDTTRHLKRTDSTQTYIISRNAFKVEKDQMESLGSVSDENKQM